MEPKSQGRFLIFVIIVLALILVVAVWARKNANDRNNPQACTLEALICPDGTAVGRSGPNCEFAPCAGSLATSTSNGVTFQYSSSLPTRYISALDWPPMAQVSEGPYVCNEAGSVNERAGQTSTVVVEGKSYCVTKIIEGAAGSIYTQYAYAGIVDTKVVTLTFSTREPQCDNYDDAMKEDCQGEKDTFDIDTIVDKIFNTIKLN